MKLLRKSDTGFFASQSLAGNLLRGATAFGLLYWAIGARYDSPMLALLAGAGALVALRGCPVCWTIGLAETATQNFRKRRLPGG